MTTSSDDRRVVLASDRGPVTFTDLTGRLEPVRRNGSVTALLSGIAGTAAGGVSWFAPSAAEQDARASRLGMFDDLTRELGFRYDAVPVSPTDYDRYYYEAGVRVLWTVWHGIEDDVPVAVDRDDPMRPLAGYVAVNHATAARIADTAAPRATVSVHDYQLMLVPAMVRARRPDVGIIHFSHTPFPCWESLARLPMTIVRTIVTGMLGADLLGFQRPRWARRFLDCCERLGLRVDHDS